MTADPSRRPSLFLLAENPKFAKELYSNTTIYIDECDVGLGVFANRPIRKGEVLLSFDGPTMDFTAAKGRGAWECMTLQIGPNQYLDPQPPAVLVNHSCDPNAGICDDRNLVAMRDIAKGEEIRYDYSTTMEEKSFTMRCCCGAANCRHVVDDFSTLPKHLQQKYLAQRMVMSFIVNQLWPAALYQQGGEKGSQRPRMAAGA